MSAILDGGVLDMMIIFWKYCISAARHSIAPVNKKKFPIDARYIFAGESVYS